MDSRTRPYKAQSRIYAEWTPEFHKQYKAEWNKNHPGAVSVWSERRRALIFRAKGTVDREAWVKVMDFYGNKCLSCGKLDSESKITMDHVIPLSRGGMHSVENLQPLCLSCNARKHAKTIDYRPEFNTAKAMEAFFG